MLRKNEIFEASFFPANSNQRYISQVIGRSFNDGNAQQKARDEPHFLAPEFNRLS
jgi:hypothetical protein